jgi:hypothetical protein
MLKLRWGKTSTTIFEDLLREVPDSALDSPRRSVVPLLDFWRDPDTRLTELGSILSMDLDRATELTFEYAVRVRAGKGKPSYTDAMLTGDGIALAFEAKYTEPQYETVRSWLGNPATENRTKVLNGWIDIINSAAGSAITQDVILDIPYQLVHRTASAFSVTAPHRGVIFLVFTIQSRTGYDSSISALGAVFAESTNFKFATVECPIVESPRLGELTSLWDGGARRMSHEVRTSLAMGPLYDFGVPKLRSE